jgi:hypothetical protein
LLGEILRVEGPNKDKEQKMMETAVKNKLTAETGRRKEDHMSSYGIIKQ